MVFRGFEEKLGLPKLSDVTTLLAGPTGKRIDSLIIRLEKLSQDKSALVQIIELFKLIQEMNNSGSLDKLITLLQNMPRGKTAQTLVVELRKAMAELGPRLDKLSNLANVLLEKE